MRIWPWLVLILTSASVAASADSKLEDPLKEWLDPFWIGPATNLSFDERQNEFQQVISTQLQLSDGFDNGLEPYLLLPLVLNDTGPGSAGQTAPRVGGGSTSRITVGTDFRLWGDPYDYLAVGGAAGFPFQTDGVSRNSILNSWLLPISIFGRLDWKWIAIQSNLTNNISTPSVITQAGGNLTYRDSTNQVQFSVKFLFYPSKSWSPTIAYTENFPYRTEVETDQSSQGYLLSATHIQRTGTMTLGVDMVPFSYSMVLSGSLNYIKSDGPTPQTSPWQFTEALRWVF